MLIHLNRSVSSLNLDCQQLSALCEPMSLAGNLCLSKKISKTDESLGANETEKLFPEKTEMQREGEKHTHTHTHKTLQSSSAKKNVCDYKYLPKMFIHSNSKLGRKSSFSVNSLAGLPNY